MTLQIGAALFAVYVIWGATYFAMHVALGFLPPFAMAGPRFVTAGALLYAILRVRGVPSPAPKQWGAALVVGVLLLACGNGFVALAQRTIDSGVAATIVATMPLWTAVLGYFFGERASVRELFGLLLGFAGVAILRSGGSLPIASFNTVALLLAPVAWAVGSLLARRLPVPEGAMSAACQMLGGGLVMCVVALLRGERPVGPPTGAALAALGFLVVFGSLVAFSAYGYLLRTTRPAVATSYAYVNPVVALGLGAALGGEPLTRARILACALTLTGVLVVRRR